ncbi:MAG: hypothetical protein ABJQ29_12970 [Luteolibacter sp.]
MKAELPENLKSTADLLSESLGHHASEKSPAIPNELLGDLMDRYAPAPSAQPAAEKRSWFQAAQSFFARPAFGLAATAAVIALIAVPTLMKSDYLAGFRGAVTSQADVESAAIILVGAPDGTLEILQYSGNFEDKALSAGMAAFSSNSPKVVVDYNSATILAIDGFGQTVFTLEIPESQSDLPDAVAIALSYL